MQILLSCSSTPSTATSRPPTYRRHLPNGAASFPPPTQRNGSSELRFEGKRRFLTGLVLLSWFGNWRGDSAYALGDPSVTLEQATPPVYPSGVLFPSEERIVKIFEKNTYSVVNVFDVTLRPQLNVTGVVEVPEGNGSGIVWDQKGHVVTNYHGLEEDALSRS